MGRNKLQIAKIGTPTGRQITYSKRRSGIVKKARELSILCDVDVLLVVFSTAGKPSVCLGEKSKFEDVIYRYAGLSPQERNKRKFESLEALKKTFKKVDHVVNIEQLRDQGSQPVEEMKKQLLTCRDEITHCCTMLGPLAEFDNINQIEDISKIKEMEQKINHIITQNRVYKENAKNYAESLMNQTYQLNGESGPFSYTMPDGQQIMLPCYPLAPQRDLAEYNTGYEAPNNYSTQDISWAQPQMGGTQQTITDELSGLIHHHMEVPLRMENVKMDEIPENKGGVSGNWNGNQNQFMCQGLEEISINAAMREARGLHRREMSGNGSNDFVDNLFEQDVLLQEENGNKEVAMHDSIFQTWTSGNDDGFLSEADRQWLVNC